MAGELYKCTCCEYESLKKYNLYRHMVSKHINSTQQNLQSGQQNLQSTQQNLQYDNKCIKCKKELSSKQSLDRHLKICKGIKNGLICHLCNKEFEHYSTKYYHVKKCKGSSCNELVVINDNTK